MLTLKCTQKVAQELGITLTLLETTAPALLPGDWFVNALKFGHNKALLFAHAPTLYSLLVPYTKPQLKDVGHLFRMALRDNLVREGFAAAAIDKLLADYQQVTLGKTDNRSVLGSMNDLAYMFEGMIEGIGGTKSVDARLLSPEINRTPQLKRGGKLSIDLWRGEWMKVWG
jgi:hypothetical protein